MAALHATHQRNQRLAALNLQYPLWLFDIDDPRWPRRLDSLPPGRFYPAKITGWTASTSEYDMFLDRPQDLSRATIENTKLRNKNYWAGLAQAALQSLRYDDRVDFAGLQVVVGARGEGGDEERAVRLSEWVFEAGEAGWVGPERVKRIERVWDCVPLWDPEIGLERLSDFDAFETYYGVAILVADDEGLVEATGMQKTNDGEGIRKAEFERLDEGGGGVVQGIVCPSRWRGPA